MKERPKAKKVWHCRKNGKTQGPFSRGQILKFLEHDKLSREDHVQKAGDTVWRALGDVVDGWKRRKKNRTIGPIVEIDNQLLTESSCVDYAGKLRQKHYEDEIRDAANSVLESNRGPIERVSISLDEMDPGDRALRYLVGFAGIGASRTRMQLDVKTGDSEHSWPIKRSIWIGVFGGDSQDFLDMTFQYCLEDVRAWLQHAAGVESKFSILERKGSQLCWRVLWIGICVGLVTSIPYWLSFGGAKQFWLIRAFSFWLIPGVSLGTGVAGVMLFGRLTLAPTKWLESEGRGRLWMLSLRSLGVRNFRIKSLLLLFASTVLAILGIGVLIIGALDLCRPIVG